MVAPSYQGYTVEGEPYARNGRMYVHVKTARNSLKEVRWNTEKEYAKQWPIKNPVTTAKQRLKFDRQGFIYIFKPIEQLTKDEYDWFWANALTAQTTGWWNWGWPPDVPFPDDMPKTLKPIKLEWEAVGNPDGELKKEVEIRNAVSNARKSNCF